METSKIKPEICFVITDRKWSSESATKSHNKTHGIERSYTATVIVVLPK